MSIGDRLVNIAEDVANTRVTFRGTTIALSDGAVGDKLGTIFAVCSQVVTEVAIAKRHAQCFLRR